MLETIYATRGIRDHRQLLLQLLLPPLLLLLLLGYSCSVSGSNADDIRSTQQLKQGSHKLCGQALNIAMDKVCENGFNSIQKRITDAIDTETEQTHPAFQLSPLLSSIFGLEVLIKTRRMRRQMTGGIHDECCVRSCDYYELRAYCREK